MGVNPKRNFGYCTILSVLLLKLQSGDFQVEQLSCTAPSAYCTKAVATNLYRRTVDGMTALDRRMCKNKRLCGYIPPLCCRSSTAIAYCYWLFFGVAAHWVLARTRGEEKDAPVASQPQRAGGFEGVKNGRISLARFNEMIISSVHVEVCSKSYIYSLFYV